MPCACPMCRAQQRKCVKWMVYQGRRAAVCIELHVCAAKEGGSTRTLLQDSVPMFIKRCMHTGRVSDRHCMWSHPWRRLVRYCHTRERNSCITPKAGVTVLYPLWQLPHLCGDAECFQYSVMSRSPHTPLNHTSSLHTFTLNHSRTPLPEVPGDPDFLHFFYSIRSYLFPHFLFICPSLLLSQVWHFSSIFPQSSCHLELGKCPLPPLAHTVD